MLMMLNTRLLVMFLSFLTIHIFASAQDTLILPITKGEYELPLNTSGGSDPWIMAVAVVADSTKKFHSSENISGYQYPLYVPRIFSITEYTDDDYKRKALLFHDTIYASVFHRDGMEGLFYAMDINKNKIFLDDEVIPISENEPIRYELPIRIPSNGNQNKEIILPLEVEYKAKYNKIRVTNLLKYDIEYEWMDSKLQLELEIGGYQPNFSVLSPSATSKKGNYRNYLLGEPFLFMNRFWMLQKLDMENNTTELVRFPRNTKPIGYKKSYYVELDSLFSDHYIPEKVKNRSDSSLFVLYFWGTWCPPCIKNMPKTKKISQLAQETDKLSMFGVALLKSGQVEEDVREFEKENKLKFSNFVESFKGNASLVRKLRNISYPNYYLFNHEGKIIHKGRETGKLRNILSKYGVEELIEE
jgi:thiol-disulfide isomerase/thioredoxin